MKFFAPINADPAGLAELLPWCIGVLLLYYGVRVAAALALVGLGRSRPRCRAAALAWAPAPLRPLFRRAIAGGLLTVALTGPAALSAQPPACDSSQASVPLLDRAAQCAGSASSTPSAEQPHTPQPPPPVSARPSPAPWSPPPASAAHAPAEAALSGQQRYLVRSGDSLWRITQQLLGVDADDAAVAAAWPLLWEANRALIGENPHHVLPGTNLQVPAALLAVATR